MEASIQIAILLFVCMVLFSCELDRFVAADLGCYYKKPLNKETRKYLISLGYEKRYYLFYNKKTRGVFVKATVYFQKMARYLVFFNLIVIFLLRNNEAYLYQFERLMLFFLFISLVGGIALDIHYKNIIRKRKKRR